MDVTALGGPHDGDTMAFEAGIQQIRFMVPRLEPAKMLDQDASALIDINEVTYQVVRWYTGGDDAGGTGRMLMVVLAPDHWPKAGPDRPVYPPPEWGHR